MVKPKFIILNFTELCNSKCTTCHMWALKDPKVLTLAAVDKAFASETFSQVEEVYMTGGEPFCLGSMSYWMGTVIQQYRPGILIRGETNCLNPELGATNLYLLRKLGFGVRVGLSLNGSKSVHDRTRGLDGSYDKVMEMAQNLYDDKTPFFFVTVDCGQGFQEICHVQEIAHKFGTTSFTGKMRSSPRYGTEFKRLNSKEGFDCVAGSYQAVIWPNGDITACDEPGILGLTVGNLYSDVDVEDMNWNTVRDYVKSRKCQPCSSSCG